MRSRSRTRKYTTSPNCCRACEASGDMEACNARDASRWSDDAYVGDREGWRGTTDVRAPDQ
eukprot:4987031-Pleurochrysis_carterae.AAC.1